MLKIHLLKIGSNKPSFFFFLQFFLYAFYVFGWSVYLKTNRIEEREKYEKRTKTSAYECCFFVGLFFVASYSISSSLTQRYYRHRWSRFETRILFSFQLFIFNIRNASKHIISSPFIFIVLPSSTKWEKKKRKVRQ